MRITALIDNDQIGRTLNHVIGSLCGDQVTVHPIDCPSLDRQTIDDLSELQGTFAFLKAEIDDKDAGGGGQSSGLALTAILKALAAGQHMGHRELSSALIDFCDFQNSTCLLLHDLSNDIRASSKPRAEIQTGLNRMRRHISILQEYSTQEGRYEPASEMLTAVSADDDRGRLLEVLDAVADCVRGASVQCNKVGRVPRECPSGFRSILVADDQALGFGGGPLSIFVSTLREIGYTVGVVCDATEAAKTIEDEPHDVFVCDLTWGTKPKVGECLIGMASNGPDWRFVIALTSAPVGSQEVRGADAICDGPAAKGREGAERVHRLIWEQTKRT